MIGVKVWLNNGANERGLRDLTIYNAQVRVDATKTSGNALVFGARVRGDNIPDASSSDTQYGGNIRIVTDKAADAILIPNSTVACFDTAHEAERATLGTLTDGTGTPFPRTKQGVCGNSEISLPDGLLGNWFTVGNLLPGYRYAVMLKFRFRLVESHP